MEKAVTTAITADAALLRLFAWEKGTVKNPDETSFAINNLQCHADVQCSPHERSGLLQLIQLQDTKKVVPFTVSER